MIFADIHNHSLACVDDGATTEEIMHQMVDAAVADGIELLCLTPHFSPIHFGDNRQVSQNRFNDLQQYAAQWHPQLRLYLSNELRHSPNCDSWLREGFCRTLSDTSLVLVDFPADAAQHLIIRGVSQLLSMGYRPVLAHPERYVNLSGSTLRDFKKDGVLLQINVGSLFGTFGWSVRRRAKQLLVSRQVDLVASDAHDLTHRPPQLSHGYHLTVKLTDKDYADRVFYQNAVDLLENNREGLVKEDE